MSLKCGRIKYLQLLCARARCAGAVIVSRGTQQTQRERKQEKRKRKNRINLWPFDKQTILQLHTVPFPARGAGGIAIHHPGYANNTESATVLRVPLCLLLKCRQQHKSKVNLQLLLFSLSPSLSFSACGKVRGFCEHLLLPTSTSTSTSSSSSSPHISCDTMTCSADLAHRMCSLISVASCSS